MNGLIDTHTHLYVKQLAPDLAQVLARARTVCQAVLLPDIDQETRPALIQLAAANPGWAYAMAGLHPCSVTPETAEAEWRTLEQALSLDDARYVAIGETGTDKYWPEARAQWPLQLESLRLHLAWALRHRLPIVLHSRDSIDDTLDLVEQAQDGTLTGVLHCFTGTPDQARRATQAGLHLGVGGVLTYPKAQLAPSLQAVEPRWLVLETDAPYLAPVPHRGKRNESSYLTYINQALALALGMTPEATAALTSENALRLFPRVAATQTGPSGLLPSGS